MVATRRPALRRRARRLFLEQFERRCLLAGDVIYQEDFENGDGGYMADNSGGILPGLWHFSVGRRADGLPNHSPDHNWYYGEFETPTGGGRYDLPPGDHEGVLMSPEIDIPDCGTIELSFSYVLGTRLPPDIDFVTVSAFDGTTTTEILSRGSGSLVQTGNNWVTATADLTPLAGQQISLKFEFDTGDAVPFDPEGWYVDDILITGQTACTADLSIGKTVDDDTPNEGQQIEYTITASNAADSHATATDVTVTDVLPSGVSFVNAAVTEGMYDDATGIWSGLELVPGETQTLTILAIVNEGTAGAQLVNIAEIMGAEDDPDSSNDRVTQTSTVNSVDLVTNKTADDSTPDEGQTVEFTIVVSNLAASNAVATNVQVRDTLPDGLDFVAAPGGTFDLGTRTVTWNVPSLSIDDQATLTLTATLAAGTAGQTLENVAVAEGDQTDPNPANNTGRETVTVNQSVDADLQVSKTVDNASPVVGDLVTFTITVTNDASSSAVATGVVVRDQLPQGLQLVSVSSGGTYDESTREVTWSDNTIDVGASQDFGIETLVEPSASGAILQNVALAQGDNPDPDPDSNIGAVTLAAGTSVQFIAPLSVYRPDGPLPAGDIIPDLTPPPGLATIAGHKWHDVNQDGVWDADEAGRSGARFFLDLDGNGLFDPQSEPSAVTDSNGRYVFQDLSPATYRVAEVPAQSDGIFELRGEIPPVTVVADQVVAGQFGVAEPPNVGVFDFSPFIRPADAFADRLGEPGVLTAITPWQVFTVRNTTDSELNITSLDTSGISEVEENFIRVLLVPEGGSPTEVSLPISIPIGGDASFLVTYDPAVRNDDRDMVIEQFPDWFGDNRFTHRAHRFKDGDKIILVTDQDASFSVNLVGGSTYDSDVSYDGVVANADIARFADLAVDNIYEPTSDPNARCPNGAGQTLASCVWAINGPPPREIGPGDFAPLSRELEDISARPPFIDLDPLNQSAVPGTDYLTELVDGRARISTTDARFANQGQRVLDSLTITISNPEAGDSLRVDPTAMLNPDFTFNGGSVGDLGDTTTLTISGNDIRLADYNLALQAVAFESSATDGRLVLVSVVALGSQSPDGPFTRLVDDTELLSNIAMARIIVPESAVTQAAMQSGGGAQDALVLIDLCVPGSQAESSTSVSDAVATIQPTVLTAPPRSYSASESDAHFQIESNVDAALVTVVDLRDETSNPKPATTDSPVLLSTDEDRELSSAVDEAMGDWESFCLPLV